MILYIAANQGGLETRSYEPRVRSEGEVNQELRSPFEIVTLPK